MVIPFLGGNLREHLQAFHHVNSSTIIPADNIFNKVQYSHYSFIFPFLKKRLMRIRSTKNIKCLPQQVFIWGSSFLFSFLLHKHAIFF